MCVLSEREQKKTKKKEKPKLCLCLYSNLIPSIFRKETLVMPKYIYYL